MPALFPPWTNRALALGLTLTLILGVGAVVMPMLYVRSPFVTGERLAVEQPVEFDHRHHVEDCGIDCLYCHADAERAPLAGVPSTDVCMGCHSQVWTASTLLEPVRASFFEERPIGWERVNLLGDFVYFDHSVHVRHGVSCASCHGSVEAMPRVRGERSMTMDFCLDCHRDKARARSADAGRMTALTTCTACHR